jgi:hypothetical protein
VKISITANLYTNKIPKKKHEKNKQIPRHSDESLTIVAL